MAIDYNKKPEQGSGGVNLSKINLTKESPTVSLSKGGAGQGVIRVNLNWSRGEQKKGFLAKLTGAAGGVDLDLGCCTSWQTARRASSRRSATASAR